MGSSYKNVFTPLTIKGVQYKNRIEMPPTSPKFNTADGHMPPEHIDFYRAQARGGAAIITLGNCSVDLAHAADEPRQCGLDNDYYIADYGMFADMCERYNVIASAEVNHAGLDSLYDFCGHPAIGPSSILMEKEIGEAARHHREPIPAIAMDVETIHRVEQMYIDGVFRLKRAGFKMCMIHGGHGNLIAQFASPLYNHRTDEYGGSFENRTRFCREILEGIRARVGDDFVLEFRVSADEMHPDGMHFDETKEWLRSIDPLIDIVNVSCGLHSEFKYFRYWSPNMYMGDMINVKYAAELKKILKARITTVAGVQNLDNAERILGEGWADFVAMARPLLADPEMPNKYAMDLPQERVSCTRCGYCGRRMMGERTVGCAVNPKLGRESELQNGRVPTAAEPKRVVVIGAGPGGMQATLTLREAGHKVILLEKSDRVGGNLEAASAMPLKRGMKEYYAYICRKVTECGADIRLNTEATPELVASLKPDAIIAAIGAEPYMPPVKGIDLPHVHWAALADMGRVETGERVVLIGGGPLGMECACTQSDLRRQVTVLEVMDQIPFTGDTGELLAIAEKNHVAIRPGRTVLEITPDKVIVRVNATGETEEYPCDTVLVSAGMRSRRDEAEQYRHLLPECFFYVIGDAVQPRGFGEATREAFSAALNL